MYVWPIHGLIRCSLLHLPQARPDENRYGPRQAPEVKLRCDTEYFSGTPTVFISDVPDP